MTNNDYSINPEDLERIIGEMDSTEGLNSLITDLKQMQKNNRSIGFGIEPKKLTLKHLSGSETLFEKVKETLIKIKQRSEANTLKDRGSFRATINFLKSVFATVPATAIIEAYNQSMGLDSRKLSTGVATKAERATYSKANPDENPRSIGHILGNQMLDKSVDTLIKAINDRLSELGDKEAKISIKPKTPQAHQGL